LIFTPAADAYTRRDQPTRNYGKYSYLLVNERPIVHTYIRFNLSGLRQGLIKKVTLRIFVNSGSESSIALYYVPDTNWAEDRITYNNAPSLGRFIRRLEDIRGGRWVTFDVTSVIKKSGTEGFCLTISSDDDRIGVANIASREAGAHAPQIIVTQGN